MEEERHKKHEGEIAEVRDMLQVHIDGMSVRTETLKSHLEEVVRDQIVTTVNGKLDKQHLILEHQNETMGAFVDKFDKHLVAQKDFNDRIEPYLQGAKGLKIVRDFFIWVGGGFVVWIAIRNSIWPIR